MRDSTTVNYILKNFLSLGHFAKCGMPYGMYYTLSICIYFLLFVYIVNNVIPSNNCGYLCMYLPKVLPMN